MFQEPGHRLQTPGPGDARLRVPFESWGGCRIRGVVWSWGPGSSQFYREGRGPRREVSKQQAQAVSFLPLCFLQSTEGNFGGLSEDVLHVLPKLGRTFQVEGGLDLLAGALALVGGGAAIRRGAWSMRSPVRPFTDLGACWGRRPRGGDASPQGQHSPSVCRWTMKASVVWPMGCSCWELCPGLLPTLPPNSGRDGG